LTQYLLNFGRIESFDDEDYIVTSSNAHALDWIERWPHWGDGVYSNITCIYGEKLSGKSHLARIWSRKSNAINLTKESLADKTYVDSSCSSYVIEDVQTLVGHEVDLFNFFEHIIHSKKNLMLTADIVISRIPFNLPDLRSRLNSVFSIEIKRPDEEMIEQILLKYFSDKQISVSSAVIKYLVARVNFSYKDILESVEKLDKASLEAQKNISIPFIKSILNF